MKKRPSYEVKKAILMKVKETPLKYSEIQRKVGTNYNTVLAHCKDLEESEDIKVEEIEHDPANGKPSYVVRITERGLKRLEKKNKK